MVAASSYLNQSIRAYQESLKRFRHKSKSSSILNTFAKIKRAFCSRVMFTRLQLKYSQKAHAKYISTIGMPTATHDKNNFKTVESNHTSNAGDEWKDNHAGYIKMVRKRGKL